MSVDIPHEEKVAEDVHKEPFPLWDLFIMALVVGALGLSFALDKFINISILNDVGWFERVFIWRQIVLFLAMVIGAFWVIYILYYTAKALGLHFVKIGEGESAYHNWLLSVILFGPITVIFSAIIFSMAASQLNVATGLTANHLPITYGLIVINNTYNIILGTLTGLAAEPSQTMVDLDRWRWSISLIMGILFLSEFFSQVIRKKPLMIYWDMDTKRSEGEVIVKYISLKILFFVIVLVSVFAAQYHLSHHPKFENNLNLFVDVKGLAALAVELDFNPRNLCVGTFQNVKSVDVAPSAVVLAKFDKEKRTWEFIRRECKADS